MIAIQENPTPAPKATPVVLRDDERQRCEVWTRVMGYHRPMASFNTGKKGESMRSGALSRLTWMPKRWRGYAPNCGGWAWLPWRSRHVVLWIVWPASDEGCRILNEPTSACARNTAQMPR
jgi:hypothetical protein